MTTKLGVNERQDLRDLCLESMQGVDYVQKLSLNLGRVLTEFDIALELLQGCLRDDNGEAYGALSSPLHEGIEKFVKRHRD